MAYKLKLEPSALSDIHEAIEYYNSEQVGLGRRFQKTIKHSLETIALNPLYQ